MPAETVRKTTTQRGLGWHHQQQVAHLKRTLIEGTPCWWCGEPMFRSQQLDGDHSISRAHGGTRTDRLLHASCNRQRGDGSRDDQRPALTGRVVDARDGDRAPWCLLEW